MRMNMSAVGQTVAMQMAGGGYLKGAQAGDVYITISGQSPDGKSMDATIVKRGDLVTVSADGQTQTLSAAQAQQQYGESDPVDGERRLQLREVREEREGVGDHASERRRRPTRSSASSTRRAPRARSARISGSAASPTSTTPARC